jgi:L-rhamnonate dehydratase
MQPNPFAAAVPFAGTARIARIEWGRLQGMRPRYAGSNARLGAHGQQVSVPVARVTTDDGAMGWGRAALSRESAQALLGLSLDELFADATTNAPLCRALEFPLLDLIGQRAGLPVYALLTELSADCSLRVGCYDTSLYMDDLHLSDDAEAAELLADEAMQGWEAGHRSFKIKVGRGARHMPVEEGARRDIAVIRAVREAVGPYAELLIDANNGWNLNLTKRVLDETADCNLYWLEEPFHEDPVLYRDLKEWLSGRGISTLIADGEGDAAPALVNWARDGLIDVLQYDIFGYGAFRWLALGREIAETTIHTAPHHYGAHLGNYVTGHLAAALPGFELVEWDEVDTPGIDASGYAVDEGYVVVPDTPGFGLALDETLFGQSVQQNGFVVTR